MTILKADSSVVRETATLYRTRPLVVRLKPRNLEIREKREAKLARRRAQ